MFKVVLFFCGVIAFLLFATISGGEVISSKPDSFYTTKDFSKKAGKCVLDESSDSCASIDISYPHFLLDLGSSSADQLNKFIQEKLIVYLAYDDTKFSGVKAFAEGFIADYLELTKDDVGDSGSWQFSKKIRVIYRNEALLTLRDEEDGYTGGAHGFSKVTWLSLDLNNGKPLKIDDILVKNSEKKMLDIADKEFRQLRDLTHNVSLEAAGYDFPNNTFTLSDNFAVVKKGLVFYYNSYDIAAYVYGSTELFIPFDKLDGVLSMERIGL